MNRFALLAAVAACAASSALAENYVARIYGNPSGFDEVMIYGAGDGIMLTGSANEISTGVGKAVYITHHGMKDMHPAGKYMSAITDSWGSTYHCGYIVKTDEDIFRRAQFWVGGGPAVDLHPGEEYLESMVWGGGGQLQVGYVRKDDGNCPECGNSLDGHAAMWSRTAQSYSRLHAPFPSHTSSAYATDGLRQVGSARHTASGDYHALLWNGPNSYGIDLHPSHLTDVSHTEALAIDGSRQGGYASMNSNNDHAALWSGSAASFTDLNPAAFVETRITSMRNGTQVGYGRAVTTPSRTQAIAWHGSAATWINLHARLPYPYNLWNSQRGTLTLKATSSGQSARRLA